MRHFETRAEAKAFAKKFHDRGDFTMKVFKKIKGHKNRIKKPFVVGTEFQWLNLH